MRSPSIVALAALGACTRVERFDDDGSIGTRVLAELSAGVRAAEHRFTWAERPAFDAPPGYQARTRDLRVHVAADAIRVVDRASVAPDWTLTLRAAAFGRQGSASALPTGTLWAEGNSLELARGPVVEYAENSEDGFEHGFRLLRRPDGAGPVEVAVAIGGATPYATDDGALFVVGGRKTVGWRGLRVWDATGRDLPAWTEVRGSVLSVLVDDEGARWPVTVDPLLASPEATFSPSLPAATPRSGFSVSAFGDQLLVGSPGDATGAATYHLATLHERNTGGADTWGELQRLDAGGSNEAREGYAVSLAEDVAAVATPQTGEVHFYHLDADGSWADDVVTFACGVGTECGSSVALFGDGAVIGAPGTGGNAGAIHLRNRFVNNWATTLLDADPYNPVPGDRFGADVAAFGDHFLVGVPGGERAVLYQIRAASDPYDIVQIFTKSSLSFGSSVSVHGDFAAIGAPAVNEAWVYLRGAGDTWTTELSIPAPLGVTTGFGSRVAVSSDTLAVLDGESPVHVHLYEWDGAGFVYTQVLDTGGVSTAEFPASLTLTDTVLAVGVPMDSSVHVWRRTGDDWLLQTEAATVAGDRLGDAVSVDGNLVALGAPTADSTGVDAGEVHLFERIADGEFAPVAVLTGSAGERYGTAVDVTEDLLAIGAPDAVSSIFTTETGRAEVYRWDGGGVTKLCDLEIDNPFNNLRFGDTIAVDAFKVLVGMPGHDDQTGAAALFGRHTGGVDNFGPFPSSTTNTVLLGTATGQRVGGSAVAISGGWLAASGRNADGPLGADQGRVVLQNFTGGAVLGSPIVLEGTAAGERFGSSLALEGTTLAIGARNASANAGRVDVYRLEASGWGLERSFFGPAGSQLGAALALQGDRLYTGQGAGNKVEVHLRNQVGGDVWGKSEELSGPAGFGEAVAADESLLIVGAPDTDTAYLYERDADVPPLCGSEVLADFAEDLQASQSVTANDSDPNGDGLTYSVVTAPAHAASYTLSAAGSLQYRGAANYYGPDSVRYRVSDGVSSCEATATFTVAERNDPPVAVTDPPYATDEDQVLVVARAAGLLPNDTDVDITTGVPGEVLSAQLIANSGPAHGAITVGADGGFTYTPDPDWFGTDTFRYRAVDNRGGESAPVTVTLEVLPVNDLPVLQTDAYLLQLTEDTAYVAAPPGLLAAASDVDGDVLSVQLLQAPAHGALTLEPNGYWRFVPTPEWSGTDAFRYEVSDGTSAAGPVTVTLEVAAVNDAPVALADGPFPWPEDEEFRVSLSTLLANDGDVDPGDVLSFRLDPASEAVADVIGSEVFFTPARDFTGLATFSYYVVDDAGVGSAPVPVTLDFQPRNDVPVAVADAASSPDGQVVVGNVLQNDTDPDLDPLQATLLAAPTNGSATLDPDGTFAYTPRAGFDAVDAFTYVVSDGQGGSATGVVTIDVDAASTEPTDTGGTLPEDCDTPATWYADRDGDGFGDPGSSLEACAAPGWVADGTDCDDFASDVFPGAGEVSGDDRDQDCDGRDNVVTAVGACSHAPGLPLSLAWLGGLLLLRRRRS
jgi:hypothetical protein